MRREVISEKGVCKAIEYWLDYHVKKENYHKKEYGRETCYLARFGDKFIRIRQDCGRMTIDTWDAYRDRGIKRQLDVRLDLTIQGTAEFIYQSLKLIIKQKDAEIV